MTSNTSTQVREMAAKDVGPLVAYWLTSTPVFLKNMGVDIYKRPTEHQLEKLVGNQLGVDMKLRKSYFLTWLIDGQPSGYSNVNQIEYGKKAFMHMHLWDARNRQKGLGVKLVLKSLPFYFDNLNLQEVFCEPYALNPAPNKTVEKIGFEFVFKHITVPGASNFEQEVNRWKLTRENYEKLKMNNLTL